VNYSEKQSGVGKRPINILVINPFDEPISGNDEVLVRVMEKMDPDIFSFVVVMPGDNPYARRYRKLGAEVVFLRMSILKRNLSFSFLASYFYQFIPTVYRFVKLCGKYEIDIVHTNTTQILGGGLAAKIMRLPSLYHAHSIIVDPWWVVRAMATWFRFTGDAMFANSSASASSFIEKGYPVQKVKVVGNPVSMPSCVEKHGASEFRREYGLSDDTSIVGIVGRINREKKIGLFLKAAEIVSKRHPKAVFVIVGGANNDEEKVYMGKMQRLAESLGIQKKVIFTGYRDDVQNIVGNFNVLAHAHTNEAFGLVIAEAMVAEVPVVAPDAGGIPELVEHERTGYLVPPDSYDELANRIMNLLDDKEKAERMGKAGREKAMKLFSAGNIADSIAQVYLQIAENRFAFKGK